MTRTDTEIHRNVIDELRFDPRVGAAEIGIAAKDGVVTLTGSVDNYARKYAAARAVERVAGVRAVADELTVKLSSALKRTDADIAHAAVSTLQWDVEVPDDKIKIRVDNGWVYLEGDVEWRYQARAAERAIQNLAGVRGVSNLIKIKQSASVPDVKERIESALKRHAELDAKQIAVSASDGQVILRGKVRSWAERTDAERAAWSSPGVSRVVDELMVSL